MTRKLALSVAMWAFIVFIPAHISFAYSLYYPQSTYQYQLYQCNGYYSYSPCPQPYYYYPTYTYPTYSYYYPSYSQYSYYPSYTYNPNNSYSNNYNSNYNYNNNVNNNTYNHGYRWW